MYFMKVRNADILLFPQKENLNLVWNVSSEIYSYMEIVHGVVSQHSWGLQIQIIVSRSGEFFIDFKVSLTIISFPDLCYFVADLMRKINLMEKMH